MIYINRLTFFFLYRCQLLTKINKREDFSTQRRRFLCANTKGITFAAEIKDKVLESCKESSGKKIV